jgi:hypothetical protein
MAKAKTSLYRQGLIQQVKCRRAKAIFTWIVLNQNQDQGIGGHSLSVPIYFDLSQAGDSYSNYSNRQDGRERGGRGNPLL